MASLSRLPSPIGACSRIGADEGLLLQGDRRPHASLSAFDLPTTINPAVEQEGGVTRRLATFERWRMREPLSHRHSDPPTRC